MSADPPCSRYARRVNLIPLTALPYHVLVDCPPSAALALYILFSVPPIELALTCTLAVVTATCSLRAAAHHLLSVDRPVIRAELVK